MTGRFAVRGGHACDEAADATSLKAHDARITKLAWAHPEYDILLASASYDCTVRVWARRTHGSGQSSNPFGARDRSVDSHIDTRWSQAAVLRDAQGTVRSIAFAPPLYGLQLVRYLPAMSNVNLMLIMTIGNSFDRRGSSRVRGIRPWFAMELPRGIGHVYIRLTYTYPRRTRWCFCNACWRLAPARSTNVDNFVWNCNAGGSQLAEHHPSSS